MQVQEQPLRNATPRKLRPTTPMRTLHTERSTLCLHDHRLHCHHHHHVRSLLMGGNAHRLTTSTLSRHWPLVDLPSATAGEMRRASRALISSSGERAEGRAWKWQITEGLKAYRQLHCTRPPTPFMVAATRTCLEGNRNIRRIPHIRRRRSHRQFSLCQVNSNTMELARIRRRMNRARFRAMPITLLRA